MKRQVTITINEEIHKLAKENNINISQESEKAIKKCLDLKKIEIQRPTICEICGAEGETETKESINTRTHGLTWLYPDEIWICNSCLITRMRKIEKG